MPNDMTREQWIEEVSRGLTKTMPDMYPEGFADYLATSYADEGGYDSYINDEFPPGILWNPSQFAMQNSDHGGKIGGEPLRDPDTVSITVGGEPSKPVDNGSSLIAVVRDSIAEIIDPEAMDKEDLSTYDRREQVIKSANRVYAHIFSENSVELIVEKLFNSYGLHVSKDYVKSMLTQLFIEKV